VARLAIALSLGALATGCQPGRGSQPDIRNETKAMNAPTPCRAVLSTPADGNVGVRFVLTNGTKAPISLETYQPFLQFRVRAFAGGAELPVVQPPLDLPVQPVTVTVPPSGTAELASPVTLRFHTGGPASTDPFVWSIAHEPARVRLTFSLDLPAPFDQPFDAQL
jgi:hypothetical protein